jgi:hypothetical protein
MAKTLLDRLRSYLEWREDWPSKEIPLVIDRIEQLEAQTATLRAAMNDVLSYVSRADYYYMEPQTIEVMRENNGG